jgi:adenylate cyclase
MRICGRAVQLDPYYAQAWAMLGYTQSNLHYDFNLSAEDGFAAAHTALSIDPNIAEAYLPMVRRLEEQGQRAEADEHLAKALELDPESWEVNKEAARLKRLRGDAQAATAYYEKAVEIMESDFHAWAMLLTFYQARGDRENVLRAANMMVSQAQKAIEQDPSNGAALGIIAGGYAGLGEPGRAREWMDRAMLIDPDNVNMRYNFACVLASQMGEEEEALKLLDRTLAVSGVTALRMAETDPDFDPLRELPGFRKMIARERKRHGLADEKIAPATPPAAS